nr:hypothetical protein [Tanacetum cinerariifolium]
NAMHDEYNALVKNGTCILVPRAAGINLVRSIWLFKHKFHADGTLSRYKARLVANGSSQQLGIDCDETFSPVVKPATIRTVLSFVVSHDIILTASSTYLLQQVITSLHNEFDMTDLGALNYFLGISATRHSTGLFLSQKQYAIELLARAHMTNCGLQYLTFTRPDISHVVQQIYLYMHDPREPHLAALKRILRYIRGTLDFGFHLYSSTTIYLVGAEAEYRGVANVVAETAWLRNLLRELHSLFSAATLVYYDNVSATYLSANPVQHQRTRHIEIDIHFVRDLYSWKFKDSCRRILSSKSSF